MSFNNDDYMPQSGKMLKSDNSIVNEADGFDVDGSQFVKNKANAWSVTTIPYSSFAANGTVFQTITGLNPSAKKRSFIFYNNLNQPLSGNISYFATDSVSVGGASINSTSKTGGSGLVTIAASQSATLTSDTYPIMVAPTDSASIALPMGVTAPTSGNFYILYREVV